MVAAQIVYDFTSDLTPTSVTPGWSSSSPLTEVGAGTIAWNASGFMRNVGGTTSLTQTTIYWEVTYGPTDPTQAWTPTSVTFKAKKTHVSTSQGYRVRHSRNAYATNVFTDQALVDSFRSETVDLSSIGEMTGPLTLRFFPTTGSTGAYLDVDDLALNAVYTPAGAADQDISPGGIASAEAFGTTAVVVVQPVDLSPAAIASGEAFGAPSVVVVPLVNIVGAGGIASAEAFGSTTVTVLAAGQTSYVTGADVAAFMDAPGDARLVAVAEIHVGVITEFARVYTRGNGFFVGGLAEPLAGVVLAATARLVGNPEQLDIQVGSVRRASFFKGWSLAEQRVLNNYRGVAT